jgi:hypothetical protein
MKSYFIIIIASAFLLIPTISFGQTSSTLKQKAKLLIEKLKKEGEYPLSGGKDTLIDLNGDNFKDILIEYYGSSGTGEKNRVIVYLYDNSKKKFASCEQLDYLANPTFYFKEKIVAGYYVANGGGHATKLKWNKSKLDTLEYIDVDIFVEDSQLRFKLDSYNYVTKKRSTKTLEMMDLPKVYRYMEYEPIIKREDY